LPEAKECLPIRAHDDAGIDRISDMTPATPSFVAQFMLLKDVS